MGRITTAHVAGIALIFVLCCLECSNARADEPARVDAAQLCAVKRSLPGHAWSPRQCQRISAAFNAQPNPVLFAAIAVNESTLQERAINMARPSVYDVGLMQIRCVTPGAVAEGIGPSPSVASQVAPELARAARIDGVTPTPRGRCTNGPARGLTPKQLLDPDASIRTAARVLAMHGGRLHRYNGSQEKNGYGSRIAALVAAFGGELRIPRGVSGKQWARVRELCRRIVEAIGKERRS